MPKLTVNISVGDALNGLDMLADRRCVESFKELDDGESFEIEALVSIDGCISVAEDNGYIDSDNALEGLDPDSRDLADGLRSLIEGDRDMACTLLARAFAQWPDASRVVEDVLHGRNHADRRQLSLVSLAA